MGGDADDAESRRLARRLVPELARQYVGQHVSADTAALVHHRLGLRREVSLACEQRDADDVTVVGECAGLEVRRVEQSSEVVRLGPVVCEDEQPEGLAEQAFVRERFGRLESPVVDRFGCGVVHERLYRWASVEQQRTEGPHFDRIARRVPDGFHERAVGNGVVALDEPIAESDREPRPAPS